MDDTTTVTPEGITFKAIFQGARTTVDGGWRISFDLSADESKAATIIPQLKKSLLQIAIVPVAEDF